MKNLFILVASLAIATTRVLGDYHDPSSNSTLKCTLIDAQCTVSGNDSEVHVAFGAKCGDVVLEGQGQTENQDFSMTVSVEQNDRRILRFNETFSAGVYTASWELRFKKDADDIITLVNENGAVSGNVQGVPIKPFDSFSLVVLKHSNNSHIRPIEVPEEIESRLRALTNIVSSAPERSEMLVAGSKVKVTKCTLYAREAPIYYCTNIR